MKSKFLLSVIAIIFSGFVMGQTNPARVQSSAVNPEINAFYEAAVETSRKINPSASDIARFSNNKMTRGNKNYKYADIVLKRGYQLASDVKKTKGRISSVQYGAFQTRLKEVEMELDKIAGSGTSAAGDPAPGTLGECWKSCNDAVGGGYGGGKGWDRFTCKAGCIITKLPPGS